MKTFEILSASQKKKPFLNFDQEVEFHMIMDKTKVLFTIIIVMSFFTFLIGSISLFYNVSGPSVYLQFVTGFLLLAFYFIFKRVTNYNILVIFLASFCYTHLGTKILMGKEITSGLLMWFTLGPVLVSYFINIRSGFIFLVIAWIEFLVLSFYIKSGFESFSLKLFSDKELIISLSFFAVSSSIFYMMVLMQKSLAKWKVLASKKIQDDYFKNQLFSLSEVAGGLAHEINNPLAIVIGNIDILLKRIEGLPYDLEGEVAKLEKMRLNCVRISQIVQSLLILSNKNIQDVKRTFKFKDIYSKFAPLLADKLKDANIELRILDYDLESEICARIEPLAHALYNLCYNSILLKKDNSQGWISISISREVGMQKLTYRDSNRRREINISSDLDVLLQNVNDADEDSFGIGLAKMIVMEEGGKIDYVTSGNNNGFNLYFPV